jgi:hypothetical protein
MLLVGVTPSGVQADVIVDTTSSAQTYGTSLSWSHKVGSGSGRLLIVGFSAYETVSVDTITYGGTDLNWIGNCEDGTGNIHTEMWYLYAPPVGTATLRIVWDKSTTLAGGAVSFFGVESMTPLGNFACAEGKSALAAIDIPAAAGRLILDNVGVRADAVSLIADTSQVERWNISTGTTGGDAWGAGSTKPGAASVTMSWTITSNDEWAIGAVPIRPAILDVSTSDSTFAFGVTQPDIWLTPQTSVIRNEGNVAENFTGQISTFTDGTNTWAVSPTTNGTDSTRAQWSTVSDSGPWNDIAAYDSDFAIAGSVAVNDSVTLWFRIQTPTTTSSFDEHSATLTVTAEQP